jgi:nucleoside-diphosphate-sugar epimerase
MAPHRFIESLLDRRPLPLYGDGRQARDFTFVGDVVAATSAALTAILPTASVLNVARGESVEVNELIAILADELGVEPVIEHRPPRVGDTPRTDGCADAARDLLHWKPVTDLRTGLRRQVEWHLRRRLGSATPVPDAGAVADGLSFAEVPTPERIRPGRPDALTPVGVGGDETSRSLQ